MSHPEIDFKIWLEDNLPRIIKDYRHFDGSIIVMSDEHKDEICYNFLLNFRSWWDDVFPPCVIKQAVFLRYLYEETEDEDISCILRGDIYLYLELHLNDVVNQVYNDVFNVQPEEFAGYEVGE